MLTLTSGIQVDESFYQDCLIQRLDCNGTHIDAQTIQSRKADMKYFIDTHDRSKGSWPSQQISEDGFIEIYSGFEKACEEVGGADLGAHVNVPEGKAYCFTKGPDADAIRRAHDKLNFPFDSITEVRRVTGVDLRPEHPKKKQT